MECMTSIILGFFISAANLEQIHWTWEQLFSFVPHLLGFSFSNQTVQNCVCKDNLGMNSKWNQSSQLCKQTNAKGYYPKGEQSNIKKDTRSGKKPCYTQLSSLCLQRSKVKVHVELRGVKMQWADSKQHYVQQSFGEGYNASFAQNLRPKPHFWNLPTFWQAIWMNAMNND